ncbi:MAG: hypothetical protein MPJ78_15170 [Hyphomicrobiaceae bacterium]|nr:hypothetical protein [Hyphomicrobiaceae bacterium]
MAHAKDYKGKSKYFDFSSSEAMTESSVNPSPSGSTSTSGGGSQRPSGLDEGQLGSSIERAADCEERALRLTTVLDRLEESGRSIRLALSAAEAVEQLLNEATRLLETGRRHSNAPAREALAKAYVEIINQIDGIAADAEFDGLNYATGDPVDVAFDNEGASKLKIEDFRLTTKSLGLSTEQVDFSSDANLVREMMLVEDARNVIATRKITIDMALSVLESRVEFSHNKRRSLQSASAALMKDGRAHMAIREIAARRLSANDMSQPRPHGIATDQVRNDNDESFSRKAAMADDERTDDGPRAGHMEPSDDKDLETEIDELQTLITRLDDEPDNDLDRYALELARILDEESYLNRWMKYERGETDVFVSHLAKNYGPELIKKAKACYADDEAFRLVADTYMRRYETGLEETVSDDVSPTEKIDLCLKTDYGKIYILLARAVGMV